ncbi:MAG: DnaB-like helicase C-terminal domain-containing protein [Mariprofundales bacterium]
MRDTSTPDQSNDQLAFKREDHPLFEQGRLLPFSQVIPDLHQKIERRYMESQGEGNRGDDHSRSPLFSGVSDFDLMTGGIKSCEVLLLASQHRDAATHLALNIVANQAVNDVPTLLLSTLHSVEAVATMMLAMRSGVRQQNIETSTLSFQDWRDLADAIRMLSASAIQTVHAPYSSVLEIETMCNNMKNIRLLVIDYFNWVAPYTSRRCREVVFDEAMVMIRRVADVMMIPVVITAVLPSDDSFGSPFQLRAWSPTLVSAVDSAILVEVDGNDASLNLVKHARSPATRIGLKYNQECGRFTSIR